MKTARDYLKKILSQAILSESEIQALFSQWNLASPIQQAALLSGLSSRDLTIPELTGTLKFLLTQANHFPEQQDVLDIVGTGGDGLKTFNISTASSLVVASCGVTVAKHGGRAVSSQAGSADLIQHLGIPCYQKPYQIIESLNTLHYAFLSAPLFNPFLNAVSDLRREMGVPTLFNILSPLANPIRPRYYVMGVYRAEMVLKIAQILQQLGVKGALVVHSQGLDEIGLQGETIVAEICNHTIQTYTITPEIAGLPRASIEAVQGGSPAHNARMITDLFNGKLKGPPLHIVLLNAAAALLIRGTVPSLKEGVQMAEQAIHQGHTLALLRTLQRSAPSCPIS